MRRLLAALSVLALVAASCSSDPPDAAGPDDTTGGTSGTVDLDGQITLAAALQAFDSCDDFLGYVKAEALDRVGPYGLPGVGGGGFPIAFDGEVAEDDAAVDTGGDAGASAAPLTTSEASEQRLADEGGSDEFSDTNVQVAGVDEPDLVKTDGQRIVTLSENQLHVVDVSGGEPVHRSSLSLGDVFATDMFLVGDRVVIMATGWSSDVVGPVESRVADIWRGGFDVASMIEVDISDLDDPAVVRNLQVDGRFVSARMVDDVARVVVASHPNGLRFEIPDSLRAERTATERNREVIEQSTIENWVPYYIVTDGDGGVVDEGDLISCDRANHPTEFAGFEMLSVATFDLSDGLGDAPVDAVGVLAGGDTVYASPTDLYVATRTWVDWIAVETAVAEASERGEVPDPPDVTTSVHQFDISDPTATEYLASGTVPGYLLNQYSMDAFEGRLRLATTNQPEFWGWGADEESDSQLIVLERRDGDLVPIGEVGGLGEGERIFSVRFLSGTLVAVVTFRQTDPLYLIDLTDPTDPTVEGELKINGFSSYLHPIGDDFLLGVGQDATDEGRQLGPQASLFDISDVSTPTRVAQWELGKQGDSPVQWDPRAFMSWPPEDMVAFPVNGYGWTIEGDRDDRGPTYEAVVLRVGDGTLGEIGRISHQGPSTERRECFDERIPEEELRFMEDDDVLDVTVQGEPDDDGLVPVELCETWFEDDYRSQIQRTLVIGDSLYSVSAKGVGQADLETLEEQAFAELPGFELDGGRPIPLDDAVDEAAEPAPDTEE